MRKCSSFMCVLVVLLSGGAEALRPIPSKDGALKMVAQLALLGSATAWERAASCRKFKDIYTDGKDMVEKMWDNSFKYETNEAKGYTWWWFEGGALDGAGDPHDNPNDAISVVNKGSKPTTCDVQVITASKGGVGGAPTPEPNDFTECHPWHAEACCSQQTVMSVQAIKTLYSGGYEWDRCGPISQACERFFVMENCFFECDVNLGHYRKFTDEEYALCTDGAGNLKPQGTIVTKADGTQYTCVGDSSYPFGENQWQLSNMPIKASVADSFYRACANDYFCGKDGASFFECAETSYRDQIAEDARIAQAEHDRQVAEKARLDQALKDQALNAQTNALTNSALLERAKALPGWAVAVIVVGCTLALGLLFCVCYMVRKEKQGAPVFTTLDRAPKRSNVEFSQSPVEVKNVA